MTESVLRTPESRFAHVPDYPFAPNYLQVTDTLCLHYVDVGPHDAAPVLMLHYDAPFPSAAHKAAARVYPQLVPTVPDDPASEANRKAWQVLQRWVKPFICCYSDGDPITRGIDRMFRNRVPGTRGQPHTTLHGGHFMQEDDAKRLADIVIAAVASPAARFRPASVSLS